ncbi:piggyBac transposable element-derived protein 4-like [Onthophagus taurus]|uniref:piggyBac transposable element-derived protein 4-like n=1 Tax=Onthophagus taurus TaxID=166361 RepID=UPI0039BDDCF4
MNTYEKKQERLLRLWAEDIKDEKTELPDDDEEDNEEDVVEERGDSNSEEEGDSNDEHVDGESSLQPFFMGKDGVTKWNKQPYAQRVRKSKSNILRELPGVKGVAKSALTPFQCWQLFFDDSMLTSIVENTNKSIESISNNYGRSRDAKYTNLVEMKALIGLIYLAGIHKSSRMNTEDLWNRDGTGIDMFWMTMSLQRFRFLLRVIRTDDKNTREERKQYDKLAPIREIFDSFVKNCQQHYTISEFTTVDEKLEAFRGRCGFRLYIPSKPSKYGIKIFALADAKTYYTFNQEVYVGQQPPGPYQVPNDPKNVVLRLIEPISKTGRNVTTDNWFTSYPLVEDLWQNHNLTLLHYSTIFKP